MTGTGADTQPLIVGARVAGGHDGADEAVVDIAYPNGAVHSVILGPGHIGAVMDALGLEGLDELLGMAWTVIVDHRLE